MHILAIETSCDDTSVAIVEAAGGFRAPKFKVFKNIVSSQIKIHRPFGGVVPNLAKREHVKNLPKIFNSILGHPMSKNYVNIETSDAPKIDAIAVTVGPGLEPALWAGIEFAKDLAKKWKKPLMGVNHMKGHLYSNWLPRHGVIAKSGAAKQSGSFLLRWPSEKNNIQFPAITLVVSGGHTILLYMTSLTKWKKLGETRDDAAGEAFDKVARMLNLPYPGGPEIEKAAKKGNPQAVNFPRPMLREKNYDFSFSGLKTAVLYYLRNSFNLGTSDVPNIANYLRKSDVRNIAASFQRAVVDVLVGKTIRAAREFKAKSVLLCGGVSANKFLQKTLKEGAEKTGAKFFAPSFEYNTDNAAMIAAAAYIQFLRNKKLRLIAQPNLNL